MTKKINVCRSLNHYLFKKIKGNDEVREVMMPNLLTFVITLTYLFSVSHKSFTDKGLNTVLPLLPQKRIYLSLPFKKI